MSWDWKSRLSKLFGGRAAQPAELTPAQISRQQITNGTHREYSPAELDEIIECMRQLKEVIQTNIMVMGRLAAATPVINDPLVQEICEIMKTLKEESYDNAQTILVEINMGANRLEDVRNNVAKTYRGGNDKHLPVYDAERHVVTGVAKHAEFTYTVHTSLAKAFAVAEPYVIIPETDRVKQGLAESAKTINPLITRICGIVNDSVGRSAGPDAPKP